MKEEIVVKIMEFSEFYPNEKFDAIEVLKGFGKQMLIKSAHLLSIHYGNVFYPDFLDIYFSGVTRAKHFQQLSADINAYLSRINMKQATKVAFCSCRTIDELWRMIFSIKNEDYRNEVAIEDAEMILFKVILAINERIYSYKKTRLLHGSELIYAYSFTNNDGNNFDFYHIASTQFYFLYMLDSFVQKNDVLQKVSQVLFQKWGISSWKEYGVTLFLIAKKTDEYRKKHETGLLILTDNSVTDETGLFSMPLIDSLSINEADYIPYIPANCDRNNNNDYRAFREKPFVKLSNGEGYVLTNLEFLCERIYNSLYFEFIQLFNKNDIGHLDYNKCFVEKFLFQHIIFECMKGNAYTFPQNYNLQCNEDENEPDFYCRCGDSVLIFECKAIKINGQIKDDADVGRLMDELYEKIVLKTKELSTGKKLEKPKPIGIGQLVKHIERIKDNVFSWDNNIPDDVRYYPILVLEDSKLIQPGLQHIINKWYKEELSRQNIGFEDIETSPMIVVSLGVLNKCKDVIKNVGFENIIDLFEQECDKQKNSPFLNFDYYLEEYAEKFGCDSSKKNLQEVLKWLGLDVAFSEENQLNYL